MARVTRLPPDSVVARICKPSHADDQGRVQAGAFELRPPTEDRVLERALSVHWLDYLVSSESINVKLAVLRDYRANPPPGLTEIRTKKTAWFATLRVRRIETEVAPSDVAFECRHDPRSDCSACPCDESAFVGRLGALSPSRAVMDPHTLIWAMPEDGPLDFAVRVHLAELVEHVAHV